LTIKNSRPGIACLLATERRDADRPNNVLGRISSNEGNIAVRQDRREKTGTDIISEPAVILGGGTAVLAILFGARLAMRAMRPTFALIALVIQSAGRRPCYEGIYVDPLLLARRILDGPAYRP
jgi:hypothetical protein